MVDSPSPCPRGLLCPVLTPLRSDKTLDTASLGNLLLRTREVVNGFVLCDPVWGEGVRLPSATRRELVTVSLEIIDGTVPVLVTATGQGPEDTRQFMETVESVVDHMAYPGNLFWVDYPLVYHGNRDLPALFENLASQTPHGWILGNHPGFVSTWKGPTRHRNIRTAVLKKIAQNPAVRGMIFVGSLRRSLNYQEAVRVRKDYIFYDGDEGQFLKNPGTGGLMAGGSNLMPGPWLEIVRSSLNRYDIERQFQRHQQTIWELGIMLSECYTLYSDAPAYYMKKILHRLGLIDGETCLERPKHIDPSREQAIDQWLKKYDIV
ncbi:hypothetical protein D3OALGA1CA_2106 [Olavius algarvensis associated proteobacterium Delta 3]|nr:hypothetical protein D3OALGA1CA_2106 [Olavius algarvensis associated proteobacterium Delta 3]